MQQKFKRPKKDSVIAKHRKWLADLQKTKDDLERQYIEELQRKQDSSKKVLPIQPFTALVVFP
jgi:hypothetical protein